MQWEPPITIEELNEPQGRIYWSGQPEKHFVLRSPIQLQTAWLVELGFGKPIVWMFGIWGFGRIQSTKDKVTWLKLQPPWLSLDLSSLQPELKRVTRCRIKQVGAHSKELGWDWWDTFPTPFKKGGDGLKSMYCVTSATILGFTPYPLDSQNPQEQATNTTYFEGWMDRLLTSQLPNI